MLYPWRHYLNNRAIEITQFTLCFIFISATDAWCNYYIMFFARFEKQIFVASPQSVASTYCNGLVMIPQHNRVGGIG